jgi:hypothetical protein
VLDLHGWGDLQTELNTLSKSDRPDKWQEMGRLVDEDVLHAFAIVADPEHVPKGLKQRFGNAVDRVSFYAPYQTDRERWLPILEELRRS